MKVLRLRTVDDETWSAESDRMGCVYFIRDVDHDRVKVGYSRDAAARLRTLQTGSSGLLEIVGLVAAPQHVERVLHRDLAAYAIRGEWFAAAGALGWLAAASKGQPMRRCIAEIVNRLAVQVWYEWDAEATRHIKHIWDAAKNEWTRIGYVDDSTGSRKGWNVTTTEVPSE